jgi:hypothetical protein
VADRACFSSATGFFLAFASWSSSRVRSRTIRLSPMRSRTALASSSSVRSFPSSPLFQPLIRRALAWNSSLITFSVSLPSHLSFIQPFQPPSSPPSSIITRSHPSIPPALLPSPSLSLLSLSLPPPLQNAHTNTLAMRSSQIVYVFLFSFYTPHDTQRTAFPSHPYDRSSPSLTLLHAPLSRRYDEHTLSTVPPRTLTPHPPLIPSHS